MAVLCTAILSSVLELIGRKIVCKQNNLPPCQRCLGIFKKQPCKAVCLQ
ncbi:unnamed protein product [Staurois parvus]|uniref:Uncharacterized protein n=1 Tax=Staurois parvus TaxID=386267 RepID=A0ABN9DD93_9NEOB|nr:unnamed protein product [Staurois parvus]